jgi:type 1 fimbriae regulatory protein FimB/type 1 fimbriae regulatory protein FimE
MKALTSEELTALLTVTKAHNESHWLMLLCTFNHGLRVSEVLSLTKDNIPAELIDVQRLKGSKRTIQPLLGGERDALLKLAATSTGYFFLPEIENRESARRQFNRLMRRYGKLANVPEHKCHAHALKHACGRLGYEGGMGIPELQTYLGHVNGKNTMVYLEATEEQASSAFAAAAGR